MADKAIGAGCEEACLLTCLGHEAPCGTKLRPGSENEGGARDRKEAPKQRHSGSAKEASELPEKISSEGKNKPKAARLATTGADPQYGASAYMRCQFFAWAVRQPLCTSTRLVHLSSTLLSRATDG